MNTSELGRTIGINEYAGHVSAPSVRHAELSSRNRLAHRVEDERVLPVPVLAHEVAKIKSDGDEELYFLKRTGFQTETQIRQLTKNLREGVPMEKSFQQIEQDIQAFKTEYLVEGPLFPIVLEKVQREGKTRIAGKMYGGKLWSDATDAVEREGTVKNSVLEMEEFLVDAAPGSMVLMTSPKGWSGYEGIKYPDTQSYVVRVQEDGSLRGFTFKTDMDLSQNEALLRKYGALEGESLEGINDKNKIKRIVSTVVKFYPEDSKNIEDIAKDIQQIKGSDVAYKDTTGQERYFSETMRLLAQPESLWTLDDVTQELVDNLKEYISYRVLSPDRDMSQDIRVALGHTVLRLMYRVRPPVRGADMKMGAAYNPAEDRVLPFDPRREAAEMEKIGGCAGGGDAESSTVNSATPRRAVLGGAEAKLDNSCSCGSNLDNHYHCPKESGGCDKRYSDETHTKRTEKCDCGFKFNC